MRITKEWLKERRACANQVRLFARHWPQGGEITRENLQHATQLGLSLAWLVNQLRFPQPAQEEFDRVTQMALDEYSRAVQAAQAECDWVTQAAWVECDRVIQVARDELGQVTQEAIITLLLSA